MIELRPVDPTFLLRAAVWFQDRSIIGNDIPLVPWTANSLMSHFHQLDGHTWVFWEGGEPIGWGTINDVDPYHSSASIHVRIAVKRLGAGIEAISKLADWAFRTIKLHSLHTRRDISLAPEEEDWRFCRLEGVEKECVYVPVWDGEKKCWTETWGDAKIYGITRLEFYDSRVFGRYL